VAGEPVSKQVDVLGLGVVAVDDLLYVETYPPADAKMPVGRRDRQCGGLTGTALVAAARLGSRCAYAGALGENDLSDFVRGILSAEQIALDHVVPDKSGRPFHSTIVVDESAFTRTIFYTPGTTLPEGAEWPTADAIRSARVLFIDHYEPKRMIRAARIAREAGIPVVADVEDESPESGELLRLADHLIVGIAFALRYTGKPDPSAAARALWAEGRSAVVVTCGSEGAWFLGGPDEAPQHLPAFKVKVVDTTGCGDVFHGAYASALARGVGLADRVKFASAAAAIKATRPGGQAGIPTRPVVESFLQGA
jgi:ribokinase